MLRFTVRTLLLLTALIAVYLVADRVYSQWFNRRYDAYYVNDVLRRRIRNGDSLADVATHFDSYVQPDPKWIHYDQFCVDHGVKDDHEVLAFRTSSGGGALLQFRDGQLVNLKAEGEDQFAAMAKMYGDPMPPLGLRYGVLPFFASAVAISLVAIWAFKRVCPLMITRPGEKAA